MSDSMGVGMQGDILVVDDTPANLQLLTKMLSVEGYGVRAVTSGAMALTVVHHSPPELILLDIRMPQMDGYEVCRKLKSNPQTAQIPVIFLSALAETEDKANALRVGGADYITKPFQIAEVMMRVNTHLTLRRLQQQASVPPSGLQPTAPAEFSTASPTIKYFSENVTVLSAGLVNCTALMEQLSPIKFLSYLNCISSAFDRLVQQSPLTRIRSGGAEYKVVGVLSGVSEDPSANSMMAIADLALAMQQAVAQLQSELGFELQLSIGIGEGTGVIRLTRDSSRELLSAHPSLVCELGGTAVDLANWMESYASVGQIQVTSSVFSQLQGHYVFEAGPSIAVQGLGEIQTYQLKGNQPGSSGVASCQ